VTAVRIVVAFEPRSHRETLRDAIVQLRPQLDPVAVAPDDLRARPGRFATSVVLLNRPVPMVQNRAFAWVVILPAPGARALVSIAGEEWLVEKLELSGLLTLIDFSLTAFHLARKRQSGLRSERPSGGMLGALRSRLGLLAPWQRARLLLVMVLMPLGFSLSYPGLMETLRHWESSILPLSIVSIAALEARQFWRLGDLRGEMRDVSLTAVTGNANVADERP
jgi:hypothetical protein